MMLFNKKYIQPFCCLILILAAGTIKLVQYRTHIPIAYHGIMLMLYLTVVIQWRNSVKIRFLQKNMKRKLEAAAFLMIFLMVIRTIKYESMIGNELPGRQLWYWYYVPIVFLPLLMFEASLYIGKMDETDVSWRWKLLYIPSGVIVVGILTNDLHQMAFSFPQGLEHWDLDYRHEMFYYAAVFMVMVLFIFMLIHAFRTGIRRHAGRMLWLPFLVIVVGLIYLRAYGSAVPSISVLPKMYALPEFICLLYIAYWESFVLIHLIPSNTDHRLFMEMSSIHAGLADKDYHIKSHAAMSHLPTPDDLMRSEEEPVYYDGGNALLRCRPVRGGHFYWMEDVSELNRLNQELADVSDILKEENIMLSETARIDEMRKKTAEHRRLYDRIAEDVKPQLLAISDILMHLPEEEEAFRQTMKEAALKNVYIKRRANLLLMAEEREYISSDEFCVAIEESLSYLRLSGIEGFSDIEEEIQVLSEHILMMHALFEETIEAALPDLKSLLVGMNSKEDELVFTMNLECPTNLPSEDWKREELESQGGRLKLVSREDGTGQVLLTVRQKGGEG